MNIDACKGTPAVAALAMAGKAAANVPRNRCNPSRRLANFGAHVGALKFDDGRPTDNTADVLSDYIKESTWQSRTSFCSRRSCLVFL
jgi:hypothetical protein